MKSLLIPIAACVLFASPIASAKDAAVEAPIKAMMVGFNTGDIAAVKALHVAAPTIVDEIAPFRWSGPNAFDSWLGDLGKSEAAEGKTKGVVWFGTPVREEVVGDHAYVVTPCSYTYTQKGKRFRESGLATFVLVKVGADWKIESWTWASPAGVLVKK